MTGERSFYVRGIGDMLRGERLAHRGETSLVGNEHGDLPPAQPFRRALFDERGNALRLLRLVRRGKRENGLRRAFSAAHVMIGREQPAVQNAGVPFQRTGEAGFGHLVRLARDRTEDARPLARIERLRAREEHARHAARVQARRADALRRLPRKGREGEKGHVRIRKRAR